MSKKVISIKVIGVIAAFAILIPGLALAGQPSDSLPDPPGLLPGKSPDTLSEEVLSHIPEGIYRTGTPDFDRAREFHISQSGDESLFQNYPIIARGYWIDGYYQVTLDEERWDGDLEIVDKLVRELQELGGEDLPIRIAVGTIILAVKAVEVDEVTLAADERDLADYDVFRTGTPDHDRVWEAYLEVDPGDLEYLARAGTPRLDGYYWVLIRPEERDVIDDIVEELRQMMGEDFPIAVSVKTPAQVDEAAVRDIGKIEIDWEKFDGIDWAEIDIYRTGTPDYDLVREFHEGFDVRSLTYWSDPVFVLGARPDGYYWLALGEENWDAIHDTIQELQRMMGEDFPVAVTVGRTEVVVATGNTAIDKTTMDETVASSSDVFGGHKATIVEGFFNYDVSALGFAAASDGEVGMVTHGHWLDDDPMPVGAWVFSPYYYYNPCSS